MRLVPKRSLPREIAACPRGEARVASYRPREDAFSLAPRGASSLKVQAFLVRLRLVPRRSPPREIAACPRGEARVASYRPREDAFSLAPRGASSFKVHFKVQAFLVRSRLDEIKCDINIWDLTVSMHVRAWRTWQRPEFLVRLRLVPRRNPPREIAACHAYSRRGLVNTGIFGVIAARSETRPTSRDCGLSPWRSPHREISDRFFLLFVLLVFI